MAKKKKTAKKAAKKAPAVKKKSTVKKTAGGAIGAKKKKASTKKSGGAMAMKLDELRARFLGKSKPAAAKPAVAKKKVAKKKSLGAKTADAGASGGDAEAVVKRAMPGVRIVHPQQRTTADAARAATVHGAKLKDLKIKYTSDSQPRDAVVDAAKPQVRSQVVFVQQGPQSEDAAQSPKAVIVRDGKVRGLQG